MNRTPFTREGYEKLQGEKAQLESQRVKAVAELKTAREMGDLSENAAYKVARMKLSSTDRRLKYINAVLKGAYVIKPLSKDVVEVGSLVTVENNAGTKVFQIVNSHESDVMSGKISYYSPIGKALVGRRINDKVEIETPSGRVSYVIRRIDV